VLTTPGVAERHEGRARVLRPQKHTQGDPRTHGAQSSVACAFDSTSVGTKTGHSGRQSGEPRWLRFLTRPCPRSRLRCAAKDARFAHDRRFNRTS